jgi:hypothetical protein
MKNQEFLALALMFQVVSTLDMKCAVSYCQRFECFTLGSVKVPILRVVTPCDIKIYQTVWRFIPNLNYITVCLLLKVANSETGIFLCDVHEFNFGSLCIICIIQPCTCNTS